LHDFSEFLYGSFFGTYSFAKVNLIAFAQASLGAGNLNFAGILTSLRTGMVPSSAIFACASGPKR